MVEHTAVALAMANIFQRDSWLQVGDMEVSYDFPPGVTLVCRIYGVGYSCDTRIDVVGVIRADSTYLFRMADGSWCQVGSVPVSYDDSSCLVVRQQRPMCR